jgi:hypothetical protein
MAAKGLAGANVNVPIIFPSVNASMAAVTSGDTIAAFSATSGIPGRSGMLL